MPLTLTTEEKQATIIQLQGYLGALILDGYDDKSIATLPVEAFQSDGVEDDLKILQVQGLLKKIEQSGASVELFANLVELLIDVLRSGLSAVVLDECVDDEVFRMSDLDDFAVDCFDSTSDEDDEEIKHVQSVIAKLKLLL
jgi:hypothetical protein